MRTEEAEVQHACPGPEAYSEKAWEECRFALLEDLWVTYEQKSRRWLRQSCRQPGVGLRECPDSEPSYGDWKSSFSSSSWLQVFKEIFVRSLARQDFSDLPWLVWLSGLSAARLWTEGSQVWFPVRAHAWVACETSVITDEKEYSLAKNRTATKQTDNFSP